MLSFLNLFSEVWSPLYFLFFIFILFLQSEGLDLACCWFIYRQLHDLVDSYFSFKVFVLRHYMPNSSNKFLFLFLICISMSLDYFSLYLQHLCTDIDLYSAILMKQCWPQNININESRTLTLAKLAYVNLKHLTFPKGEWSE